MRIASLVPSLTELVVALGLGDRLVARTGYCIHPADVLRGVPKIGGTKGVNLGKLRRLAPTHVLVNVDETRLETVDAMRAWGEAAPVIVVTHPKTADDNLPLIARVASEFASVEGVGERASALLESMQRELALTSEVRSRSQRVLYLIWSEPWMTVARDTYISSMLARIGWHTWPDVRGGDRGSARYPVLRGDEPWLAGINRVLLSSEPFDFAPSHAAQAAALCPQASVAAVDGELLSWYGPRALAGLRYLRQLAAS